MSQRRSSNTPQSPSLVPSPRAINEIRGWNELDLCEGGCKRNVDPTEEDANAGNLPVAPPAFCRNSSIDSTDAPRSRLRSHSSFTLESVDGGKDVRIVSPMRVHRESVVQSESERTVHIAYKQLQVSTHAETGQVFKTFFTTYVVLDADTFQADGQPIESAQRSAEAAPRPTSYTSYMISQADASVEDRIVTKMTQFYTEDDSHTKKDRVIGIGAEEEEEKKTAIA